MSDPSSAPPPQPVAPPEPEGPVPARHEHLLELEAGGKGWKRRRTVDFLKISPAGMELHHGGMLREPLILPLGAIAVAAAEPGPARALPDEGRFPILRRIARTKVVPREEGVEGWLWTTRRRLRVPVAVRGRRGAQRRARVHASAGRGRS